MQLIERAELDVEKWEELRRKESSATLFSSVTYLDATAENWCVLVDPDFSFGIALPYTLRLGVKTLYVPLFCRQLEVLFPERWSSDAYTLLLQHFPTVSAVLNRKIPGVPTEEKKFQFITPGARQALNSQAKRMLKKFQKQSYEFRISRDPEPVFQWIESELKHKVKEFDNLYINKLKELVNVLLQSELLEIVHICNEWEVQGGMFFMKDAKCVIYLKGAASEGARKHGAMYALMDQKISETLASGKLFDFGGSDVPGVRRFNLNLGAADAYCYRYSIDNGPLWFRVLKKLRTRWKRK